MPAPSTVGDLRTHPRGDAEVPKNRERNQKRLERLGVDEKQESGRLSVRPERRVKVA